MAPPSWGKVSAPAQEYYLKNIYKGFDELQLCEGDWKATCLTIENYSGWACTALKLDGAAKAVVKMEMGVKSEDESQTSPLKRRMPPSSSEPKPRKQLKEKKEDQVHTTHPQPLSTTPTTLVVDNTGTLDLVLGVGQDTLAAQSPAPCTADISFSLISIQEPASTTVSSSDSVRLDTEQPAPNAGTSLPRDQALVTAEDVPEVGPASRFVLNLIDPFAPVPRPQSSVSRVAAIQKASKGLPYTYSFQPCKLTGSANLGESNTIPTASTTSVVSVNLESNSHVPTTATTNSLGPRIDGSDVNINASNVASGEASGAGGTDGAGAGASVFKEPACTTATIKSGAHACARVPAVALFKPSKTSCSQLNLFRTDYCLTHALATKDEVKAAFDSLTAPERQHWNEERNKKLALKKA
ncbi:hypothetical protein DXG01_010661 [Tephrocybe rancida]|nr:hypothetical protein DXG01_010661 [Tephrocybe rancida]